MPRSPRTPPIVSVPFNRPYASGAELEYIKEAIAARHLSGDGRFTRMCNHWLEERIGCAKALLTHSATAALEMAILLAEIGPGDEVVMPSFTFPSTANAVVLRGGVPVFVDIRPDTLNIDEELIEAAITPRTRAIMVVHYAGVGAEMDRIMAIAAKHSLIVIEDAAQALLSRYRGRPLGSIAHFAAVSFHETKNIISGEGGALLINDPRYVGRAEIIREKGTNRSAFFRGEVDKYSWVDLGSSYLPSEIIAAYLWAQLEQADEITERRAATWRQYHTAFAALEEAGRLRRPVIPDGCVDNAHIYYLVLSTAVERDRFLAAMKERGIGAIFHYVPLDSSPAGRRFGRAAGTLVHSHALSARLARLPLWFGMADEMVEHVVEVVGVALQRQHQPAIS